MNSFAVIPAHAGIGYCSADTDPNDSTQACRARCMVIVVVIDNNHAAAVTVVVATVVTP